eukprot:TRINITY_DN23911_c0_g1_i1.p1 TRINITY_DN23911_c0_g1~~TRINITY_DN23911_c0_g1_i1.p1  ORF type:complete len:3207 (+),score=370.81 TRINITY_DN23911_c0_g1_i1:517-9621(+)
MGKTSGPLTLSPVVYELYAKASIVFMHGGMFKLCYSPHGTFGDGARASDENIVYTNIKVFGVSSGCSSEDGCLQKERWECTFGYKGESVRNCKFDFRFDGGRSRWSIEVGRQSKLTWTKMFGNDLLTQNGEAAISTSPKKCAVETPELSVFDTSQTASVYMHVDASKGELMPPVSNKQNQAFTLAACYCPNYDLSTGSHCTYGNPEDCCDTHLEFIQMVGLVYFWTLRICDYDTYTSCTGTTSGRYMRVVPQQKFVVRIDCPPAGACMNAEDNRIHLVPYTPANDRPSWALNTGCRSSYKRSNSFAIWPDGTADRSVSGGTRLDYKAWHSKQVKLGMSLDAVMDICFANSAPDLWDSWFKIGQVRTTSAFAFAKGSGNQQSTQYVGHPGTISLYGGLMGDTDLPHPYESNRYSGRSLVKVISFDRESIRQDVNRTLESEAGYDQIMTRNFQGEMDRYCGAQDYSASLVEGPSSVKKAEEYMGNVDSADENKVSQLVSFSGPNKNLQMTFQKAGVIAVCYCAILKTIGSATTCRLDTDWLFVGRLTISGPVGGQVISLPTEIVVSFSLQGWGFSKDDRLRIVENTPDKSCKGDPDSYTGFRVACPGRVNNEQALGCTKARGKLPPKTSIQLHVETHATYGAFIQSVEVGQQFSVVRFNKDITNVFEAGDLITIDFDRIKVHDKLTSDSSMTHIHRLQASRLSGEYEFQDKPAERYQIGHRVQPNDATSVRIPVGFTDMDGFSAQGMPFSFQDSSGYWAKRNKEATAQEIKATRAADGLLLCWGVQQTPVDRFYYQAGTINFVEPDSMASAAVSLTTVQKLAVAPVVISFTTDKKATYGTAGKAMTMLMLRFLDVKDKLEPYYFKQEDGVRGSYQMGSDEIFAENTQQYHCGKIFTELWSDHAEGFPMPVGCHYSQKLADVPDGPTVQSYFREFFITFQAGNGIRPGTEYQIVLNAAIKNIVQDEQLVDIYTQCAGFDSCAKPYHVFEKGKARASKSSLAQGANSAPRFAAGDGFFIQLADPMTHVADLSKSNVIQFRMRGGDGAHAIIKESIIRLYMWPLTSWSLGASCSAFCIPYHNGTNTCRRQFGDSYLDCTSEAVVKGTGKKNIIKINLPVDMTTIDSITSHTIKLTGLTLPLDGFFPIRIGAQVTIPEDTSPFYTASSGFITKSPHANRTSGRVVITDRSGFGPKPFRGDSGNLVYVRLQLGVTLWNLGRNNAAFLSIMLPRGYGKCNVSDGAAPPEDLNVFLLKTDGYLDNNRGILAVSNDDGDWINSDTQVCVYKLSANNQAIYAGMVFYIGLTVQNPSKVLQKIDPGNTWRIQLDSFGQYDPTEHQPTTLYTMPVTDFISLEEEAKLGSEYWSGNLAVISNLNHEVIQPSDFLQSCCQMVFSQRSQEYLQVFFETSVYAGQYGYVILDAPIGFDFGKSCKARDLPESHYAFVGANEAQLLRLARMASCVGEKYPMAAPTFNRAKVKVGGIIEATSFYGYEIQVLHPTVYETSQHNNWYLWIQDSRSYLLDGSRASIKFNKNTPDTQTDFWHKSWGMYSGRGPYIGVQILDNRPWTISRADTQAIVYPILFDIDTDTSLRITAPLGFVWSAEPSHFIQSTNGTIVNFPSPRVENNNQMVWDSLSFRGNTKYGFRAGIRVPNYNPVVSGNNFFLEFGFNEQVASSRRYANIVKAQMVAAITNAEVYYSTSLLGYRDNRIEFAFQTVSELTLNTGVVIKGSPLTVGFELACPFTVLPESAPLPSDATCIYELGVDLAPQITLKMGSTPIPAGYYRFEMTAANPSDIRTIAGTWKFGSYYAVANYPETTVMDMEIEAAGFRVDAMMPESMLTTISDSVRLVTGRNDRPGQPNQLIFHFSLSMQPPQLMQKVMTIRAPRGFIFYDDCLEHFITDINEVFGPNTRSSWPPDYTVWTPDARPVSCAGFGREAFIGIPPGALRRFNKYVFRIGIRVNPLETPVWNKWSLNYNDESSDPFVGFTLWTNTDMKVIPVGTQRIDAEQVETPIEFRFSPYNTVPAKPGNAPMGGVLRMHAPPGFKFVALPPTTTPPPPASQGVRRLSGLGALLNLPRCSVQLSRIGGGGDFTETDHLCLVDKNGTMISIYMAGAKYIEGLRSYTAIVMVTNPNSTGAASGWRLESFAQWDAHPDQALDDSTVVGYDVNDVLEEFHVTNTNSIFNGKAKINDIDIVMRFPDELNNTDLINITGPKGYNLIGNPEERNCNEFRWVGTNPLPASGPPTCECDDLFLDCNLSFRIWEGRHALPALAANTTLRFKIATQNPSTTPVTMENYWRAAHLRYSGTTILSSHIRESWHIKPQLEDIQITLVGNKIASGEISDIKVQFTAITFGDTISIQAAHPAGFNFDSSLISEPYVVSSKSEGDTIILNNGNFKPGGRYEISISTVRLGASGGPTTFNLNTYTDDSLMIKKDESLNFRGGFRLPGLVQMVVPPLLQSQFKEQATAFPVKSLFPPRLQEDAKAVFVLSFARQVKALEKLVVTCQGSGRYFLKAAPFTIIGMAQIDTSVELDEKTGELRATLKPGRPATEVALQAHNPYTLTLWVLPVRGINTWRFETTDGGALPSNTNDGKTEGFSPVEPMKVQVYAVRSPPRAVIDVFLKLDAGNAVIRQLTIIAPPSFTFDTSRGSCGDMCTVGRPLGSTSRMTATLAMPTGVPISDLTNLKIHVMTPQRTPSQVSWFVEGREQATGPIVAWGEEQGFFVTQMAGSSVTYPAVAGLRDALISFTFILDVDAGNVIYVVAPPGFVLTCSREGTLKQISLPGGKPDCVDDPLEIKLDSTLTNGKYAFALIGDIPETTPTVNSFSLVIRDVSNRVVDAAFAIQGVPLVNIGVCCPNLAWSASEPNSRSSIELGISFSRETPNVKAVLLMLPELFEHQINTPLDVVNMDGFPVSVDADWADIQNSDRIVVSVDVNSLFEVAVIKPGTYRFSFPVKIPRTMSRNNFWSVSLCNHRNCAQPNDRYTIVSFPIAGFQLFEMAPQALRVTTSAAVRAQQPLVLPAASIMAMLLLLASAALPSR